MSNRLSQDRFYSIPLILALLCSACTTPSSDSPSMVPLAVSPENPRYFTDGTGKAILLTGSHTWNNIVDMGTSDPPPVFDFDASLQWMTDYGHNFIRLWTWELLNWGTAGNHPDHRGKEPEVHTIWPHAYARTGPGTALDGKPKFDLTQYDPEYFDRLRTRVEKAREAGIYVSVMLFEGWALQHAPNAWENHPFHPDNNINGIDADANGDGSAVEVHELGNPDVTAIQEAYVREVIETLNGFDNLLWEISNENHPASTPWQYHMIEFVHETEASMPQQHPVGMTFQFRGGSNEDLFNSPAEWISPNHEGGYRDDPPAADGSKVIISDTDHLWGIGGDRAWVWKSFLRGLNPIFMDPYDGLVLGNPFDAQYESVRKNLGYIREYADRVTLVDMTPQSHLASTGYCLANEGREYLAYLPANGRWSWTSVRWTAQRKWNGSVRRTVKWWRGRRLSVDRGIRCKARWTARMRWYMCGWSRDRKKAKTVINRIDRI